MIRLTTNKFLLIVLVCLSITSATLGQLADSVRIIVEDGYIEKMDDNIIFKVGLNDDYEVFEQDVGYAKYILFPNISTNISLGLDYRFISVSYQFAPKFIPGNADNDERGSTNSKSFGLSFIFRHWLVALSYDNVGGYYLRNTSDLDPTWQKGDPYFKLPKFEYLSYSLDAAYNFNDKLSIRSLTSFTERQLKSAGSFFIALQARHYITDRHTTLVDPADTNINNQKSFNYDMTTGPGYWYTYVYKESFFASIGAEIGLGLIHTKIETEYINRIGYGFQNNPVLQWNGKAAVGYNGRSFFTGFYVNISGFHFEQNKSLVVNHDFQYYYQFILGIRLASPKWLKNQMAKLDKLTE